MSKGLPLVGHSMAIFASSAAMLAVSVIAVAMRCLVRSYVVRAFGWDDGLMVTALVIGFDLILIVYQLTVFTGSVYHIDRILHDRSR